MVVGDLLVVCAGDKVAADGVLAVPGLDRGGLLAADESSLTGESEPVKKSVEEDPWVRWGSGVSGVVVNTSPNKTKANDGWVGGWGVGGWVEAYGIMVACPRRRIGG